MAVLFSLSLLFFIERGAYRALRESRTGDFATVYAAARCWMHGENPYARADLRLELVRAGAPTPLIREQDRHASLYLVSAMPFLAVVALLPWTAANITWCLVSIACFAASIFVLVEYLPLSQTSKWVAASFCLISSPTYVGILNGNPSVVAISLTILSLHFALRGASWTSGILLAVTLCLKPQVALCGVVAFVVWKCWPPLLFGLGTALAAALLSVLQVSSWGHNWAWWASLTQNLTYETSPGGLTDARPASPYASQLLNGQTLSYLVTSNERVADGLVLLGAAGMTIIYFCFRKRDAAGDLRSDAAFLAAMTLTVTYHRYYDGQLLLLLLPAAISFWQTGRTKIAMVLGACLAVMALPLQSVIERVLGPAAAHGSVAEVILLRHEPLAIVAVILVLGFRSFAEN